MANYSAPGVYFESNSFSPKTIQDVPTSIAAFIGYTQISEIYSGQPLIKAVNSLQEYIEHFGGACKRQYIVSQSIGALSGIKVNVANNKAEFSLYYAVKHFFENGGELCYITSIGSYNSLPNRTDFINGLTAIEQVESITLIALTEAACLLPARDYYHLCSQALAQCEKLINRITLIDSVPAELTDSSQPQDWRTLRNDPSLNLFLENAAAYTPYLKTIYSYDYDENEIAIEQSSKPSLTNKAVDIRRNQLTWGLRTNRRFFRATNRKNRFTLASINNESASPSQAKLHQKVKALLDKKTVTLPPSAAVAGMICRVDKTRGIWKAPANQALMAITAPAFNISDAEQQVLNVDPIGGKSINAIRAFTGRGILVWGARTFAANNQESRYLNVKRLTSHLKKSIWVSLQNHQYVSNDISTWQQVKNAINNYLKNYWRQGALQGSTPEDAFFVKIGLGETMSQDEIRQGKMIVQFGIAPIRPAEFIVSTIETLIL